MPTYSFSVSVSYSLTTHHVKFTKSNLEVYLTSTNEKVYDQSFANGLDFRCSGNDFQIGTLTADEVFTKTVDLSLRAAGFKLVESSGANAFVGSENIDNPSIYHTYNLNQCPVRLSKTGTTGYIKCPCESESGPCGNSCYSYGD